MKQLSDKQQRFIELYAGNAAEAAKLAGYAHPEVQGRRLMRDVHICSLIQEKRKAEIKPNVADRIERQEFWTAAMRDETKDFGYRIKVSELLGKSEGDFLDRVENSGEISLSIKWAD